MGKGTIIGASPNYRAPLIANLTDMGVPLTGTETVRELISFIKEILVGDVSVSLFDCVITPTQFVSTVHPFEYFEPTEIISFTGCCKVTRCNLIAKIDAEFALTNSAGVVSVAKEWVAVESGDATKTVLRYVCPDRITKFKAQASLEKLCFKLTGCGKITMTVRAYDAENTAFDAAGAVEGNVSESNTWRMIENVYPTWDALAGETWAEIESLRKSDYVPEV